MIYVLVIIAMIWCIVGLLLAIFRVGLAQPASPVISGPSWQMEGCGV